MITSTFEKTATAYNGFAPVKAVRRARRAYIGLHGFAFDFAAKRAKLRFEQLQNLTANLVEAGQTVEAEATQLFETAKDKAADILPRDAKVNVEIDVTPKAVRKAKPKTAKAKVKTTKTIKTPKAATVVAVSPAKKAAKPAVKVDAAITDKYTKYVTDIMRYDAKADKAVIKKIVDHLGIALSSRDGQLVACSDESERNVVRDSWLKKKLGLESVDADLDARVLVVCDMMKADRFKNRVTFYYLLAKEDGKLAKI